MGNSDGLLAGIACLGALAWWLRRQAAGKGPSPSRQQQGKEDAAMPVHDAEQDEPVHVVGSSVNLPDMSAHLAAKVSVSSDQQADPARMAAVYDNMADKFRRHGLTLPAVEAMRQYFSNLEGEGQAQPLDYADFSPPLPPGAVRLCVVFFQETNRRLMELVHQAAQEVMAALPEGAKFHLNRPSHYHITVFMTSQPHTLRPDPFDAPAGGLPQSVPPEQQAAAAQPAQETLLREIEEMRGLAATSAPPHLEVHSLLLADSGTLLLCSVDRSGNLAKLRSRLRASFPGAPSTQSSIMHASLARLLSPRQLSVEQIGRIQEVCDRWTERLRGMRFDPEVLYHIRENTFTTVEGPRIPLPFQKQQQQQHPQLAAQQEIGRTLLAGAT